MGGNSLARPGGQPPDEGPKCVRPSVWPGCFEALNLEQGAEVGATGSSWRTWGWGREEGSAPATPTLPEQRADNPIRSQKAFPATAPAKQVLGARHRIFCFFFWGLIVLRIGSSGAQRVSGPLGAHLRSAGRSRAPHHRQHRPQHPPWELCGLPQGPAGKASRPATSPLQLPHGVQFFPGTLPLCDCYLTHT